MKDFLDTNFAFVI